MIESKNILESSMDASQKNEMIIFYDEGCTICKRLAAFGSKRAPSHVSFAPNEKEDSEDLEVVFDSRSYRGADAWEVIIKNHPDLRSLNWLAAKLGLVSDAADLMNRGGKRLREWCPHCGWKGTR